MQIVTSACLETILINKSDNGTKKQRDKQTAQDTYNYLNDSGCEPYYGEYDYDRINEVHNDVIEVEI